jgi:NADH:ubiquinone oxidoreductase subunit F (NADH-binding)
VKPPTDAAAALSIGHSARPTPKPPPGSERLLAGWAGSGSPGEPISLDDHLAQWGSLPPRRGSQFLDELDRSGLRGRGGAWFPVGTKWRAVHRVGLRNPVVVANGTEGEPASGKDRLLITQLPHLVLDGAALAAATLGASEVVVHVPSFARLPMSRAIEERRRRGLDSCAIDLVVAPDRYLAGQESAAVNAINGGRPATPTFVKLRSVRERGVRGRPTLVQNVESLAHASLIARFGADWFRRVGTQESPGTTLLTVTGRWPEPRIVEAPLGTRLADVLGLGVVDASTAIQGVLLGGYGGGWVATSEALGMPLTEEAARHQGSSIGAGVVVLLPSDVCPLLEVSRVVRYMQSESAGQCGPCVNGLDVLAHTMELLAVRPSALRNGVSAIPTLCGLVEGRGACAHPDGVARFVRTATRVFENHASLHLRRGPCHTTGPPILPLPTTHGTRAR